MIKNIIFCLFIIVITSCSWFSPSRKEVEIQPPPKVTHVARQKPRAIKRELGSLWSEDSSWNQIYSPTQNRAPGDIITVKLDKKFLSRLELGVKRPEPEEEIKKDEKDNKNKKKDKAAPEATPGTEARAPESEAANASRGPASAAAPAPKLPDTVELTIVEVLPRGNYRVAANQGFKPALDAPFVYIQGVVRDKEIAEDNTVSSNSLLDLKFEGINRDMKVITDNNEDER